MSTKTLARETLRWLFVATFQDGSELVQDENDSSKTTKDGSAFTDVLAKERDLAGFSLVHANKNQMVTVDLVTGTFVVNGTPLVIHDQNFDPSQHKLRLIYFRETRVEQEVDGAGERLSERHFVNRYFIGWQTTVNGKNKQVTLAVG